MFLVGCSSDISNPAFTEDRANQTKFVNVVVSWTAPTTGSPVDYYTLEARIGGKPYRMLCEPPDTFAVVRVATGVMHVFRVAGTDSMDRTGPYSVESDPYIADPDNELIPMIVLE